MPALRSFARPWIIVALLSALIGLAGPRHAAAQASSSTSSTPPTLAVLDFEFEGDPGDEAMVAQRRDRMVRMSQRLREKIAETGLYRVLDNAPAQAEIDRMGALQHLHRCNGCELDIARSLGAQYVMLPYVFRVSQLVITFHAQIKEVSTGRVVMRRALDFRNDADGSWEREIAYLMRDMREGRMWNGGGPR